MLPKQNRLSKTKDINKVLRFGRKFNTKSFTISISQPQIANPIPANFGKPNPKISSMYDVNGSFIGGSTSSSDSPLNSIPDAHKSSLRESPKGEGVALTTGKLCIIVSTKYGKANKRNLLRRRIRAITRQFILTHEYSVIFQVKKGVTPIEFEQVESEITEILSKL